MPPNDHVERALRVRSEVQSIRVLVGIDLERSVSAPSDQSRRDVDVSADGRTIIFDRAREESDNDLDEIGGYERLGVE